MSVGRFILCLVFPPLAVLDKGCGTALIVGILWLAGIFPGIIAALIINFVDASPRHNGNPRYVEIPVISQNENVENEQKRKGTFVRLADGELAEVIDDDGVLPEKYKREDYL